jgi:tRNA (guanine-N7-)-methyltransferase
MANPFARQHNEVPAPIRLAEVFENPLLPLYVDIGCARGKLLQAMALEEAAKGERRWNYLGMELRPQLVEEANQWRDDHNLRNLHFVTGSANTVLRPLFAEVEPSLVQRVCIQFPDPWAKARHRRRRVVQPGFVHDLAYIIGRGGEVFISCDYEELFQHMKATFLNDPAFALQEHRVDALEMPSEREIVCERKGRIVYRGWFTRTEETCDSDVSDNTVVLWI